MDVLRCGFIEALGEVVLSVVEWYGVWCDGVW